MSINFLIKMRKIFVFCILIYIITYYGFDFLVLKEKYSYLSDGSEIFYLAGEIMAIVIISLNIAGQEKEQRLEWIFFAIGICGNFIGDFIWVIKETVLNQEVVSPGVFDAFYIPSSWMFIIALYMYIKKEKIFSIVKTGFDIAIVMVISSTYILNYVLIPIWSDESVSMGTKLVYVSYPLWDLAYLAGLFSILLNNVTSVKRHFTNIYLIIGFSGFFIADMGFAILDESDTLQFLIDPLWPVGMLCMAIAPYYKNNAIEKNYYISKWEKKKRVKELFSYIHFLFPYLISSMVILKVSFRYISRDPLVTGSVIAVLLIMIRQIFTLLDNKKLLDLLTNTNNLLEQNKTDLEEKNYKLKKLKEQKEREANTDYLTGLFNRRYIYNWMKQHIKQYLKNENMQISVLLIDIDNYKNINDSWGHDVGDMVLTEIAILIKDNIRTEDVAGRYGGDEFIVILPNANETLAQIIAERILEKANKKRYTKDNNLNITLSIGVNEWKGKKEECSLDKIIIKADSALYEAKENGRNQVRIV